MIKIDTLQQKMSWVYLINLIFYFIPLFTVRFAVWEYVAMAAALLGFLYCYFWAYRVNTSAMHWPVAGIVLIATLITPVNPGSISLYAYAGFFIGFAYSFRIYLVLMALLVVLLVALYFGANIPWDQFLVIGIPIILAVSFLGRAEHANARRQHAKQQSEDEIKQLAAMVERERIARDLHDILGHTLSSVILKADLSSRLLARQQNDAAQLELAELSQIARDALSQVRQSVSGYKHQGLIAELTKLMSRLREAGFATTLSGEVPKVDPRRETALILALTELTTNVIRHSKGDSCRLSFVVENEYMSISLFDNGEGIAFKEGNGISGLRERLSAIAATLRFEYENGVTAKIQMSLKE